MPVVKGVAAAVQAAAAAVVVAATSAAAFCADPGAAALTVQSKMT